MYDLIILVFVLLVITFAIMTGILILYDVFKENIANWLRRKLKRSKR